MKKNQSLLIEDVKYFISMLERENRFKKYNNLFKDPNSKDYQRFINVYKCSREALPDKERTILDSIYGVNNAFMSLKHISKEIGVSPSRIGQIRFKAELLLRKELTLILNPEKRNLKYFMDIISEQTDEVLLKIGLATRPWEKIVQTYLDKEPTKERRKKLENKLYRMWSFNALDHRDIALEILNVSKENVIDY